MRRFEFSLETVLRVKKSLEEKVQLEFSMILERRAACLREISFLEHGLQGMLEDQREGRQGGIDAGMIRIFEMSRKAQLERISWQTIRLGAIETELEVKRQALIAASRERKVLEKLKENQYQTYLKKLNREEQAFLDELASHLSLQRAGTF